MSFYCKPPAGQVGLDVIRRAAFVRLKYLIEVLKCGRNLNKFRTLLQNPIFVQNANFIMEGTKLDCMSYFLLSMLTSGNPQLAAYIIDAECQLFEFRMRLNSEIEILKSIKIISKFVASVQNEKNFSAHAFIDKELIQIFHYLNQYGHIRLVKCLKNRTNSPVECIQLPFTCVLRLVAKRSVNLHNGMACVPTDSLFEVILYIFEKFVRLNSSRFKTLSNRLVIEDIRIKQLLQDLQGIIGVPETHHSLFEFESGLTATLVDNAAYYFPPCMLHIHRQLRQKHRLKHHARIQYTLFLKELGMSLMEAVKFWSEEYNKSSCCGSEKLVGTTCCNHSWSKDHKRYVYNLRHLYGLEGAKVSYSGHCCRALQNKLIQFGDDGGCPFRHFDSKNLKKFLISEYGILDTQIWTNLNDLLSTNQYCKACSIVLHHVKNNGEQSMEIDREFLSLPVNQFTIKDEQDFMPDLRYCQSQSIPTSNKQIQQVFVTCYDHDLCKNKEHCDDAEDSVFYIRKPSDFYKNSRLSHYS